MFQHSTPPSPLFRPGRDDAHTPQPITYRVPDELRSAFDRFITNARGYLNHSPASIKWYTQDFAMFLKYLALRGITTIDETNARTLIQEWVGHHRERGISPFTARSYWQGLRPFFVFLDEVDKFPNPYRTMKPPAVPDALPKALPEEDCIRILDAAAHADWSNQYERARAIAMLATALYAGLRRNEILKLKFMDVDLDRGSIRIERGKGRGGGKDRMTYMAPELQAILRSYLEERRRAHLTSVEFFTSQQGGHGLSAITIKRIVEHVRKTAGIHFSLHVLRHSFVTMMLRANVPIHVVRELAGHTSITTTARYTRVFEEDKRQHMNRLTLTRVDQRSRKAETQK